MSPDLQRLLEAWHQKLTCPKEEQFQRDATFERLFGEALAKVPHTTREQLLDALRSRYAAFLTARRPQPPTDQAER